MRNLEFGAGEYYHVFNRGNHKQSIFRTPADYTRFLFLILHLQSPINFPNIGRHTKNFVNKRHFGVDADDLNEITKKRVVELIAFVLMPNHFHLMLKTRPKDGISKYMHKILMAYSKYANTKYDEFNGHIFQGAYKAVHIDHNKQALYLSAYLHRNPRELVGWKGKELQYPWSSYQDYVTSNRLGNLLVPKIVMEQFTSPYEYKQEVEGSPAKELDKMFNTEC